MHYEIRMTMSINKPNKTERWFVIRHIWGASFIFYY